MLSSIFMSIDCFNCRFLLVFIQLIHLSLSWMTVVLILSAVWLLKMLFDWSLRSSELGNAHKPNNTATPDNPGYVYGSVRGSKFMFLNMKITVISYDNFRWWSSHLHWPHVCSSRVRSGWFHTTKTAQRKCSMVKKIVSVFTKGKNLTGSFSRWLCERL